MRRWMVAVALAASLGGCGSFTGSAPTDPARTVIGVSAPQPRDGDSTTAQQAAVDKVQWKADQICTSGFARVQQDVEPAENSKQLVDWQLRCAPYRLNLFGATVGASWPF